MEGWTIVTVIAGVVSLITLLYLVIAVGVRDENGNYRLSRFDHVFAEIQVAAICIIFFYGGAIFTQYVDSGIQSIYGWELGLYNVTAYSLAIDAGMAVLLGGSLSALGLGLGPVSYTHLDVYKRQRPYCSRPTTITPSTASLNSSGISATGETLFRCP